jgi:glyoxylase-like metal-dependent hydrolase (beta-lactamase superfamily II)
MAGTWQAISPPVFPRYKLPPNEDKTGHSRRAFIGSVHGHFTGTPDIAMNESRSRKIGDIDVTAVSDGILNVTLTSFLGIAHDECARLSGWPIQGPIPLSVNAYLVQFNGKKALVDAGCASTMGPALGKLPENLNAIGVNPDSIDYVLLTHIHPDHSNGLVNASGEAAYPNAEVIVSAADAEFALDRDPSTESNDFRKRSMIAAQRAFAPYSNRTRRIGGGEIFAGITACPQPGHTPGHTGWLISSRNDALLIWGDVIHIAGVQFERPDAALTFDLDPEMARKARQRVLDWATTDRIRVAGSHIDLPSYGYVARKGAGYTFVQD